MKISGRHLYHVALGGWDFEEHLWLDRRYHKRPHTIKGNRKGQHRYWSKRVRNYIKKNYKIDEDI